MTDGNSQWRGLGNTDLQSFRTAIARSWTAEPSPMRDEAEAVFEALRPHGLVRLGAAMAWHESKNASWNCATAPAGQPCIPLSHRNPWAMKARDGTWLRFVSYAEAAREWATRLLDAQGPYGQTRTLRELIEVYAPGWDGNDTGRYVETVAREIDALPRVEGSKPVEPTTNPYRKPVIYSLATDHARFGLSKRQADKILSHRFLNRQGNAVRGIVLHIQEGTTPGSLSWWASGSADASSSVMVQKDGSLLRVIEDRHGPYTNGDVSQPTARGRELLNATNWVNPNLVTVTVEAEGYSGDQPTEAMVETICWMVTEWMQRHGLTLENVYRHGDLNSVSRAFCPGRYFDVVMARLKGAAPQPEPEDEWVNRPAWMDPRLIPLLFPEATPDGLRTQSWLRWCGQTGLAPARKAFVFQGTADELVLFEGGLLIDRLGRWVGQ